MPILSSSFPVILEIDKLRQHITMTTVPLYDGTSRVRKMNKNLQSAASKYVNLYQDPIPKEIAKFATKTGQVERLEHLLQEQINLGEPVNDWEEFAKPLNVPYRRIDPDPSPFASESNKPQSKIIHKGKPEVLGKFREKLAKALGVDLTDLEKKD